MCVHIVIKTSALDGCTLSEDVILDGKVRSVAFQSTNESIAAAARLFATHYDLQENAALRLSRATQSSIEGLDLLSKLHKPRSAFEEEPLSKRPLSTQPYDRECAHEQEQHRLALKAA